MDRIRTLLRRFRKPVVAPVTVPVLLPFIVTICPDCGAAITWREVVIPGTGVEVVCRCQARWVAVAPTCSIIRAQDIGGLDGMIVPSALEA